MILSSEEVQKMKVAELRVELSARNLDSRGVKAILVDRLLAAFATESGAEANLNPVPAAAASVSPMKESQEIISEEGVNPASTSPARSMRSSLNDATPKTTVSPTVSPLKIIPKSPEPAVGNLSPQKTPLTSPVKSASPAAANTPLAAAATPPSKLVQPVGSPVKPTTSPVTPAPASQISSSAAPRSATQPADLSQQAPAAAADTPNVAVAITPQGTASVDVLPEVPETAEANAQSEEPSQTAGEPMETEGIQEDKKRKIETINGNQNDEGRKPKKFKAEERKVRIIAENEPDFEDKGVVLDWYKSDLNLRISETDFLKAEQIVFEEFPWAYAGVKATHGFNGGKVCYELKWVGSKDIKADIGSAAKHVVRVGWSDIQSDLQLGEEKFSYSYDSTGKFFSDKEEAISVDVPFVKDDVITTYLDMESDPVEIKFSKNGSLVGAPIQIPKADLEGKVLFPHILVRNTSIEANFGHVDPAFPVLDGYQFAGKAEEHRIRGPKRADAKADCEFVMLVGMACSGKTRWAKDKKSSNPDQHFNILGTSTVVERVVKDIAVAGLLMKAGKFVEKLVDIAPSRRRNYILDQSNVLTSVQRRKAGGFEGFKRSAVVMIPSDEEYQNRIKSREQEQGKSVPKSTVLDMKAGFRLPETGDLFTEVEYPELGKSEAEELVKKYNAEGSAAGYGQRPVSVRGGGPRPSRGGRGLQRGQRGGFFRGDPRGGRGVWRGGPPRGGPPPFRGGPPPRGFRGGGPGFPPRGMAIPSIDRVSREPPGRGFGRGGPPRGIPSLANIRRGNSGGGGPPRNSPRGGRGSGAWDRGNSVNGGNARPLFPRGGRGGTGTRGSGLGGGGGGGSRGGPSGPSFSNGSSWGHSTSAGGSGGGGFGQSPGRFGGSPSIGFGGQQRFGGSPQGQGFHNNRGGGQVGGYQGQVWGQGNQPWDRGNMGGGPIGNTGFGNFGGGGSMGNQFADPWTQQVPDQGYGQSWDNSGTGVGIGGNNRGTWQGYGGQTFGNYNSGGGGYGRK